MNSKVAQSESHEFHFIEGGKVGLILKHKAPLDHEYVLLRDFDELETFALAHMEEPHSLFEELAELLHLALAHEEYMRAGHRSTKTSP